MFKVTFSFEDGSVVEHFANAGDNLLELAREANVAIDAPCSGNASCGKCRVQLKKGELDSKKTLHISDEEYQEGWRLACCSKISADVNVLVPDIASAYKSRMKVADLSSSDEIKIFETAKEEISAAGIEFSNNMSKITVKMNVPTLDDTMPDNERLAWKLREETGAVGRDYRFLGEIYPTPGYCAEIIWLYACRVDTIGDNAPDPDEFLDVARIPLDEAEQMVLRGEIPDAKTQIAVLKVAALHRRGQL